MKKIEFTKETSVCKKCIKANNNMENVLETYKKNKDIFNEFCNLPKEKIIEICERFILDKSDMQYMFREEHSKGTNKYFDIQFANIGSKGFEPYIIKYSIRYYDDIEVEIKPFQVTIKETMQHCSGLETVNIDFEVFYNEYVK